MVMPKEAYNACYVSLGGKLPQIREIMGWTQEELAGRMGVSRAIIIQVEKTPTKMTRAYALGLFMAVFGELERKKREIEALPYDFWDDSMRRPMLVDLMRQISFGKKSIISIMSVYSGTGIDATRTMRLLQTLSRLDSADDDAGLDSPAVRAVMNGLVVRLEKALTMLFDISNLSISQYMNNIDSFITFIDGVQVEFRIDDIIDQQGIDVIVCETDSFLSGRSQADYRIHSAAGPELKRFLDALSRSRGNGFSPGEVVYTDAYKLNEMSGNQGIIHCIVPPYLKIQGEDEILGECYKQALKISEDQGMRAVALPALAVGFHGFPLPDVARVALTAVRNLAGQLKSVQRIRFVLNDSNVQKEFLKALEGR